ncbi:MAG: hypothetical protein ACRYFR_04785 [Janthinobacterium lividum]
MSVSSTTVAKKGKAELAVYSLNHPDQLGSLAELVQQHIEAHKLYTPIQGKKYVNVEGWQFAGAMLGLVPLVESVADTSTHQLHTFKGYSGKPDTELYAIEFRATVGLLDLRTGQTVGRGIASCSNLESRKRTFDPYAVESMAQTRAVGKAFRLLIGWLMQAGGYATTPAEEMPDAEPETSAQVVAPEASKKAPAEAEPPVSAPPAASATAGPSLVVDESEQVRKRIIQQLTSHHITPGERSRMAKAINKLNLVQLLEQSAKIAECIEYRPSPQALKEARAKLAAFAEAHAIALGEARYKFLSDRSTALTVTAVDLLTEIEQAQAGLGEGKVAA